MTDLPMTPPVTADGVTRNGTDGDSNDRLLRQATLDLALLGGAATPHDATDTEQLWTSSMRRNPARDHEHNHRPHDSAAW